MTEAYIKLLTRLHINSWEKMWDKTFSVQVIYKTKTNNNQTDNFFLSYIYINLSLLWSHQHYCYSIQMRCLSLTFYTLTSVCKFSIQFSIHFLRCFLGEFVKQSRDFFQLVIISFILLILTCDSGIDDIIRRNQMLITPSQD